MDFLKDYKRALSILLITFIFFGCAMMKENTKKKEEAKKLLEKQKKNYTSLATDLKSHKIKIGITSEEIEAQYGKPADNFDSSSEVSQFQMWIYEYPDAESKEGSTPIRLYFSNGKLSFWSK